MKFLHLTKTKIQRSGIYDEPIPKIPEPTKPLCYGQKKSGLVDLYGNRFNRDKCLACRFQDNCNTMLWHKTRAYKKVLRVRRRINRVERGHVPARDEDRLKGEIRKTKVSM